MDQLLISNITYFDEQCVVICDMKCSKAWGIASRPNVQLSDDEDDIVYLADGELGEAPENPGTYEGIHMEGKPSTPKHNRWCVRECERSTTLDGMNKVYSPRDYSERVYNLPWKHEDED